MSSYTLEQIQQNLDALNSAYYNALSSGGLSSYTINSGQGSTTVKAASPSELLEQIKYWTYLKNETLAMKTGSHVTIVRDLNDFRQIYKYFS